MFKTNVKPWGEVKVIFRHNNPDSPHFSSATIPGTDCIIMNKEDDTVSMGETELCNGDTYWKELGRKLSLTRAVEKLDRDERRKVWNAYFESRGKGGLNEQV